MSKAAMITMVVFVLISIVFQQLTIDNLRETIENQQKIINLKTETIKTWKMACQ